MNDDDDVHYNIDDGGDGASEPPGEGAVVIIDDVVDNDDNSVDGGGGFYYNTFNYFSFVEIRTFDSGFGLEIRIPTPSRVELIGKGSIFGLETKTNR